MAKIQEHDSGAITMGNMPSDLRRQVYFDKSLEEMKHDKKPTERLLDLEFENDDHLDIQINKIAARAYHSSKLSEVEVQGSGLLYS